MEKPARQPSFPDVPESSGTHRLDRRRLTRVPVDLEVAIEFTDKRIVARATDIGLGGMFIESSENPAYGDALTLHVLLPGANGSSRLPAVVRWVTEQGFGVQFGLLTARETHAIAGIIQEASG